MKIASFDKDIVFSDDRIKTAVILESTFSKEIRITMKKGQEMKEHKTPFSILVHVLSGKIDFGVGSDIHTLDVGGIIALEGNIPHNLLALEDSVVRLSLSKLEKVERVVDVVSDSSSKY